MPIHCGYSEGVLRDAPQHSIPTTKFFGILIMFHLNSFVDGVTWSLIDTAKGIDRYATPVARWYCRTFFSAQSAEVYRQIGVILGDLMVLAIMAGMIARQRVQAWVDAQVEGATSEIDPFDPGVNDAYPADAPALLPTGGGVPWFVFPETLKRAYGIMHRVVWPRTASGVVLAGVAVMLLATWLVRDLALVVASRRV
jgi:hypothetical protein